MAIYKHHNRAHEETFASECRILSAANLAHSGQIRQISNGLQYNAVVTMYLNGKRLEIFSSDKNRIIVLGSSGQAKEVRDVLRQEVSLNMVVILINADEEEILHSGDLVFLGMGSPQVRSNCFRKYREFLKFPTLIHPDSSIGSDVELGNGTLVQAGAVLTTCVRIGVGSLINTNVTIGHDVKVGNFSTINPGATVSGNVVLGEEVLVGANSTILQNLIIGSGARIGAGAVVTKNVAEGETVVGNPARGIPTT